MSAARVAVGYFAVQGGHLTCSRINSSNGFSDVERLQRGVERDDQIPEIIVFRLKTCLAASAARARGHSHVVLSDIVKPRARLGQRPKQPLLVLGHVLARAEQRLDNPGGANQDGAAADGTPEMAPAAVQHGPRAAIATAMITKVVPNVPVTKVETVWTIVSHDIGYLPSVVNTRSRPVRDGLVNGLATAGGCE